MATKKTAAKAVEAGTQYFDSHQRGEPCARACGRESTSAAQITNYQSIIRGGQPPPITNKGTK